MSRNTKSKGSAGFTLLEVMVSLAVGGIALGSMYTVGAASTRHFREQQRISAAQTSLRAAMATLKHDFQRAGFMSTPSSRAVGEACAEPIALENQWVGAVNGFAKSVTKPTQLDPDNLNKDAKDADGADFFSVDQVWLTGNFATSGEYPNISVSPDGQTISIPMGWQSFQRDFSEWTGTNAGTCNLAVFQSVFPEERLVRLHAQNGTFFYGRIASTTCSGNSTGFATVTLHDSVPSNCNMEGGWIAPVNTMFYRVTNAELSEDDNQKRTTVLRRTEVKPDSRLVPLEATVGSDRVRVEDRSLLDYVVRFKVDFLMMNSEASERDSRISYVPMTELEWLDSPQRVRGARIDVAVRTPQQEPDFTADVAAAAFKLYYPGKGAARVRRMRAELLLPNIANRNLP
jgi:prepilin-type N-terminal cleavage/methylation domain-containing protein